MFPILISNHFGFFSVVLGQPRSESQAAKFRLLSPASKTVALKKIRMERAERTRALKQESKNRYAQRATRNRSFTTSRRRRRRRQKTKSIASSVKLELDDTVIIKPLH